MYYVISDTHFGHKNILQYSPERFDFIDKCFHIDARDCDNEYQLELMERSIIKKWNSIVGKDDIVYFLGDFTLKRNKQYIAELLSKLNGRIHLIRGNHDTLKSKDYIECGFESVANGPILLFNHIFLSHKPLPHKLVPEGYINYFGHVHQLTEFNWERGICACIEQTNCLPIAIDSMISKLNG